MATQPANAWRRTLKRRLVVAAGGLAFFSIRHSPRCTITGKLTNVHLSSDGSRMVTVGPLQQHRHSTVEQNVRL